MNTHDYGLETAKIQSETLQTIYSNFSNFVINSGGFYIITGEVINPSENDISIIDEMEEKLKSINKRVLPSINHFKDNIYITVSFFDKENNEEEGTDITMYKIETDFGGKITPIFIDKILPDIKKIYELMKNTKYNVDSKLFSSFCDVETWMEEDGILHIIDRDRHFKIDMRFDNWITIKYLRGVFASGEVYDTLFDISHGKFNNIKFNDYNYVKILMQSLSPILYEFEE